MRPARSVDHFSNLPVPSFVPGNGAVFTGSVRWALRLEAFAAFASATAIYAWNDFPGRSCALFLAPDLAMLAYFAGPRAGALAYNLAHSAAFALALTLAGFFCRPADLAVTVGLIWIAHIGIDRALGYGLKYPTSFDDTHLGRIGRR